MQYFPGIVGGPEPQDYDHKNYIACFASSFCEPFDKSVFHVFNFRVIDHQLDAYRNLPKNPRMGNISFASAYKNQYFSISRKQNIDHEYSALNKSYYGRAIPLHQNKRQRLEMYSSINYFYSLNALTYRSVEAALAGAISIVIPVAGVSKEEWFESTESSFYGVAYGEDDIPNALATLPLLLPYLKKEHRNQNALAISFVKDVLQFFNIT